MPEISRTVSPPPRLTDIVGSDEFLASDLLDTMQSHVAQFCAEDE